MIGASFRTICYYIGAHVPRQTLKRTASGANHERHHSQVQHAAYAATKSRISAVCHSGVRYGASKCPLERIELMRGGNFCGICSYATFSLSHQGVILSVEISDARHAKTDVGCDMSSKPTARAHAHSMETSAPLTTLAPARRHLRTGQIAREIKALTFLGRRLSTAARAQCFASCVFENIKPKQVEDARAR